MSTVNVNSSHQQYMSIVINRLIS